MSPRHAQQYSSGKITPSKPISASFGINSDGKREASSHSITWGPISESANSRTLRRRCCCSSVKEKSTGPQASFSPYGRTNYLYHTANGSPWGHRGWVPKLQLDAGAEKDLTQRTQRITENHREIGLFLSAMYSSSSPWGPQCSLWPFSVSSVLNSEQRDD